MFLTPAASEQVEGWRAAGVASLACLPDGCVVPAGWRLRAAAVAQLRERLRAPRIDCAGWQPGADGSLFGSVASPPARSILKPWRSQIRVASVNIQLIIKMAVWGVGRWSAL